MALVSANYQERYQHILIGLAAEPTSMIAAGHVLDCLEAMHNSPVWQPQIAKLTPDNWCNAERAPGLLQQFFADPQLTYRMGADVIWRLRACFPVRLLWTVTSVCSASASMVLEYNIVITATNAMSGH